MKQQRGKQSEQEVWGPRDTRLKVSSPHVLDYLTAFPWMSAFSPIRWEVFILQTPSDLLWFCNSWWVFSPDMYLQGPSCQSHNLHFFFFGKLQKVLNKIFPLKRGKEQDAGAEMAHVRYDLFNSEQLSSGSLTHPMGSTASEHDYKGAKLCIQRAALLPSENKVLSSLCWHWSIFTSGTYDPITEGIPANSVKCSVCPI